MTFKGKAPKLNASKNTITCETTQVKLKSLALAYFFAPRKWTPAVLELCLRYITTYPQPKNSRGVTVVGLRIVREEYRGVDQVGVVGVPPARWPMPSSWGEVKFPEIIEGRTSSKDEHGHGVIIIIGRMWVALRSLLAVVALAVVDEVFISSRTRLARWDLPTPWGPNRSTVGTSPADNLAFSYREPLSV